jgi:hypothetical protein
LPHAPNDTITLRELNERLMEVAENNQHDVSTLIRERAVTEPAFAGTVIQNQLDTHDLSIRHPSGASNHVCLNNLFELLINVDYFTGS